MIDKDKDWVRRYTYVKLTDIFDYADADELTDLIIDEVINDIDETADKDFHSGDIDIAIARVLKSRIAV